MKIVIDTNALEGDRYARRPVADAAWRGAAAGDFEIVIPEVVVQELVKHFPEKLAETLEQLGGALKKRGRELGSFGLSGPEMPSVDVDQLIADYEAELRARCSEAGCRIASVDLRPALSWSVNRRKPFSANGHGLPDAAIWLTVLELAADDEVILVTNNSEDFGKPGNLLTALRRDVSEHLIPEDRVRIVDDLFALQREVVEPAAEAAARVGRLLADDRTRPTLTESVVGALRWTTVDLDQRELGFHLDDPPAIRYLDVEPFAVLDAYELGEERIAARLQTRAYTELDMVVWRGDYGDAERAGALLPSFVPDDNAFPAELYVWLDLTVDVVLRLDGALEEAAIAEVKRLPRLQELQLRFDAGARVDLLLQLEDEDTYGLIDVSGYRPPEPVLGSVEQATVKEWRADGPVRIEKVLNNGGGGWLLQLSLDAVASVSWLVSVSDPSDLDRFASIAEGVEDGGGYLHDTATEEPIELRITARLTVDGWEDVDVEEVVLRQQAAQERAERAAAAEDELDLLGLEEADLQDDHPAS
jgi:hypothetical protein